MRSCDKLGSRLVKTDLKADLRHEQGYPQGGQYGTLKAWGGNTPFLTRTLEKVRAEVSLAVMAYNMKRVRLEGSCRNRASKMTPDDIAAS